MFQINIFMYFFIKMEKDSVIILNSKKEKKPFFQIILICGLTVLAFIFLFILIWFFKDNKKPSEIGIDVALLNKQQEELQKELEEAKQQRIIESAKNANIDNSIRIQEKIKLFKNLDFEDSKQIKLDNLTDEYAYNMNFLIETITNNTPPENPNDFLNLLSILYKNKYFAQNIIGIKDTFYSYLFDRSLLSVNYFSEKEIRDNNPGKVKVILENSEPELFSKQIDYLRVGIENGIYDEFEKPKILLEFVNLILELMKN